MTFKKLKAHSHFTVNSKNQQAALLLAVLLIISLLLSSCGGGDIQTDSSENSSDSSASTMDSRYTHLSMDEAQSMIEAGTPGTDYILLDTRQENVFKHDHIPGAICIPDTEITALSNDAEIPELPDKDQTIIVYCQFGGVSKVASEKLCDMGYTNIYEFDGMDYWKGEVEYGDDYE